MVLILIGYRAGNCYLDTSCYVAAAGIAAY
jgi:hypothetical protein